LSPRERSSQVFYSRLLAAAKINKHGTNDNWEITVTEDSFLLDQLRKALLALQNESLEETVAEYNKKHQDTTKVDDASTLLKALDVPVELENIGKNNKSIVLSSNYSDSGDPDEAEILHAIKGMNQAERLTLARGVLATQWSHVLG
jgi:sulfite reductase alpha subunit-like flavoprotein